MKNKTIAIIPARGGSKRLPNKNILQLGDIPLLAYSILYAKSNSNIIDSIYVTTDDDKIKKIALEFGAQVIDRPEELSGDYEPTITSLKHVLFSINKDVENVILLQPTNPLRAKNLLNDCFQKFISLGCDSLFTVSKNENKLGEIVNNTFVPFNYEIGQRSQDIKPLYYENGLLYITKAQSILEDKIITQNSYPYIVNHIFAKVDIDTQEDFEYANYLLNKFKL